MKKPNYEDWEKELEKKEKRRVKRKKKSMKVSGSQVKNLQKIIIAKRRKRVV